MQSCVYGLGLAGGLRVPPAQFVLFNQGIHQLCNSGDILLILVWN